MFAEKNLTPNKVRLLKTIRTLAWLGAVVVFPLYAWKVWLKSDYTDFSVYYRAAVRMSLNQWNEVYSLNDGASPFRYAPVTLPFLRPFAALSAQWAKMLWYFLQYLWFGLGIYFLQRSFARVLSRRNRAMSSSVAAFSALFILRFCLDCFTIGQISSLLFLAFCASFYSWLTRRTDKASAFLLLPALVKIGPAFLYPLFLHGRPKQRQRALFLPLALLGAILILSTGWIAWMTQTLKQAHEGSPVKRLWSQWILTVTQDSSYYDASHYGSQSIKSAALRMVNAHWLSLAAALKVYGVCSVVICSGVLSFWMLRVPRRPIGRGFFFALGLFPYLWVMPETFKYSMTVLAIPVGLLFADLLMSTDVKRSSRFSAFSLALGILTLSLAGKDLIGDYLFFGLQKASVPLLTTFVLGIATASRAMTHSRDSGLMRELKSIFRARQTPPWDQSLSAATLEVSLLAPLPMHSATSLDEDAVIDFIQRTNQTLLVQCGQSFEILIQPYGDCISPLNPCWLRLQTLTSSVNNLRLLELRNPNPEFPTRHAALRKSFLLARGKTILTTQLEQPCDPEFYPRALAEIAGGAALVRGNRRVLATRFRIPVRLLSIVYQRHRLGLRFNQLVRFLLPIQTTDTHSGIFAASRTFATQAFALQSSLDFIFDLELALIAGTHAIKQVDLPLILFVAEEKQRSRMFFETLSLLIGLPRLMWRHFNHCYDPMQLGHAFTADDWGLTPEVNQGILELAQSGIIRRVSMMANSSYLTHGLTQLLAVPNIQLGLHFDLTYAKAAPNKIFVQWLQPFTNRLNRRTEVQQEFQAQLKTLQDLAIEVQYLDGHHHIHLVPGVLKALTPLIREAGIKQIRLPYDPALWWTPKWALNVLALLARRTLRTEGFRSHACFYPQKWHFSDPGRLRSSLIKNPGAEIIVHPARQNDLAALKIADPYQEGRVTEYRALRMLEVLQS